MITGEPDDGGAIAAEAGVDDFLRRPTPEDKLKRSRLQAKECLSQCARRTNDAPRWRGPTSAWP